MFSVNELSISLELLYVLMLVELKIEERPVHFADKCGKNPANYEFRLLVFDISPKMCNFMSSGQCFNLKTSNKPRSTPFFRQNADLT